MLDTYWLAGNVVNHFMALTEDFEPAGGYTLAAVMSGRSEAILGTADTNGGYFFTLPDGTVVYRAAGGANQVFASGGAAVTGRHVIIIRVTAAGAADIYVNGVLLADTVAGSLIPTRRISTLLRSNTLFSGAATAGAVLVDRAIGDAEVSMLNLYLLAKGGIAL